MTPPGYLAIGYETLESNDPNNPWPEAAYALEGERVFMRLHVPHAAILRAEEFCHVARQRRLPVLPAEPKKTDQVFIELVEGLEASYTTRLIAVGGKFSMKLEDPDEKYGGVVYHIDADYLR